MTAPVGWWFFAAVPVGVRAAAVIGGQYVAGALGLGGGAVAVVATLLIVLLPVAVVFSAPRITSENYRAVRSARMVGDRQCSQCPLLRLRQVGSREPLVG